jgi:hypothetical protein
MQVTNMRRGVIYGGGGEHMPLVSAEVRWFLKATHAAEVEAFGRWFHEVGGLPPGGGIRVREDVYVVDPATDELGVKDRGGRPGLEVKAMVEPRFLALEFGSRQATAQLWSKITSSVLTLPAGAAGRCTTRKTRWLRKFDTSTVPVRELELGRGPFGEEPLQGSLPDVGCNLEWTSIEVPGTAGQWWTVGLEAFAFRQAGPIWPFLEAGLRRTIAALDAASPRAPSLGSAWREASYASWIRQGELRGRE